MLYRLDLQCQAAMHPPQSHGKKDFLGYFDEYFF